MPPCLTTRFIPSTDYVNIKRGRGKKITTGCPEGKNGREIDTRVERELILGKGGKNFKVIIFRFFFNGNGAENVKPNTVILQDSFPSIISYRNVGESWENISSILDNFSSTHFNLYQCKTLNKSTIFETSFPVSEVQPLSQQNGETICN